MAFKPMLAGKADDTLTYPKLASVKLDGIRCIITPDGPVTRKLLPIPNRALAAALSDPRLLGLDGELIGGDPTHPNAMQHSTSAVMRENGAADAAMFYVFDHVDHWITPLAPFRERLETARAKVANANLPGIKMVFHQEVRDAAGADYFEHCAVEAGYEGMMLRNPEGRYKFGRSTTREGGLLKVKRWQDAEGTIVSVYEGQHNGNVAERDALGRTKRSSAKAGKSGKNTLGGFVLECPAFPGVEVRCAPGVLTAAERETLWIGREALVGRTVTFKYQPHGVLNAPRFPGFKAFRED